MEYTFNEEIHKNIKIPNVKVDEEKEVGIKIHIKSLKSKLNIGANINGEKFEIIGCLSSFRKSLAASAKGCRIPIIPTLFGPLRI